jgi:FdrA protein
MPLLRYRILPGLYRDSVALMRLATGLLARRGITQAAAVMATPANRATLVESGLPWPDGANCRPDDLLLAAMGDAAGEVEAALDWAEGELRHPTRAAADGSRAPTGTRASAGPRDEPGPRSLAEGWQALPQANLALISVPGEYAYAEALKALKAGRHVFLFSNGVSLEDEARLKQMAAERGVLMMGPDCGTACVAGVPLGFANAVRRGNIGLVAASGSGLQEVMCLIDNWGGGISHAIGAGGRDLQERVGGQTTLAGLRLLQADRDTAVVVVLSKPPAAGVAEQVLQAARALGKPCVVGFQGADPGPLRATGLLAAATLEEAARLALGAVGIPAPQVTAQPARPVAPPRRFIRGLFAGGSLCSEAAQIMEAALGPVCRSAAPGQLPAAHLCLDLGDEVYTRGRPHPMIDARLRAEWLRQAAHDPETEVVLFDVILGYGASADPAGPLIAAIHPAGDGPAYVAHVCGTEADPQNRAEVVARLHGAGVSVVPTNAAGARLAVETVRA